MNPKLVGDRFGFGDRRSFSLDANGDFVLIKMCLNDGTNLKLFSQINPMEFPVNVQEPYIVNCSDNFDGVCYLPSGPGYVQKVLSAHASMAYIDIVKCRSTVYVYFMLAVSPSNWLDGFMPVVSVIDRQVQSVFTEGRYVLRNMTVGFVEQSVSPC